MKNLLIPCVFAAAGLLPQGEVAAQSFGNKLPVNSVNCAAIFTVPPTNKATNPDFETMSQARACGYKYIETNSFINPVPPT